jgi:hypothetical protein
VTLFLRRRFRLPEHVCFGNYFSRRLAAVDRVAVAAGLPGILMRFNASATHFIAASFHFLPDVTSSIMSTPALSTCEAIAFNVGKIRL